MKRQANATFLYYDLIFRRALIKLKIVIFPALIHINHKMVQQSIESENTEKELGFYENV